MAGGRHSHTNVHRISMHLAHLSEMGTENARGGGYHRFGLSQDCLLDLQCDDPTIPSEPGACSTILVWGSPENCHILKTHAQGALTFKV